MAIVMDGAPGVGARDLRDCLLIQIDRRGTQGITQSLARAIVADHLEPLARGAIATIARRLGVTEGEVTEAKALELAHGFLHDNAVKLYPGKVH